PVVLLAGEADCEPDLAVRVEPRGDARTHHEGLPGTRPSAVHEQRGAGLLQRDRARLLGLAPLAEDREPARGPLDPRAPRRLERAEIVRAFERAPGIGAAQLAQEAREAPGQRG